MITIYNHDGNVLLEVPITKECVKTEELMASDFIQLSWRSAENITLPAGAYIYSLAEKYYLTEPYSPTQKDEIEFGYTPQFHSKVMLWQKLPFFLYTDTELDRLQEPDWELTSNANAFMDCIVRAIKEVSGETWEYNIGEGLPSSAYIHFDNTDIYSALNSIASEFDTEWYADKGSHIIYLGKIAFGDYVELRVGEDIGVPSVSTTNEGYYNRFYAFGSTRNISQKALEGTPVNTIANKRLTLNKENYPKGYYDTEPKLGVGNTFVKTLYFDDIYPRATDGEGSKGLKITDVRMRLMYYIDEETGEKIELGIDENGKPIYDSYAIWYFRIPQLKYDKGTLEIAGLKPMLSFESGALQGFEFEFNYHDKAKSLTSADGTPFEVQEGDYEIFYVDENNVRIPSLAGLIPSNDDVVALFNIALPDSYIPVAQEELETAMMREINRLKTDFNSYTFKSNPIAFANGDYSLSIGQKVRYINEKQMLETRVKAITSQLDYPIEKTITIGNAVTKGVISELKSEVANANKNIDLVKAINDQTQSLLDAYKRTQEAMMQGFARINEMWKFDGDNIYSPFGVYSKKFISARGKDATIIEGGGGTGDGVSLASVWQSLTTTTDEHKNKLIALGHIPSLPTSKITDLDVILGNKADKATTLAGYGITDAVKWNSASYYNLNLNSTYEDGGIRAIFKSQNENRIGIAYSASDTCVSIFNYANSKVLQLKDALYYDYKKLAYADEVLAKSATASNSSKLDGKASSAYQTAVYAYKNTSKEQDTTTLPNILAPSWDGIDSFKFYDTKFYSSQSATSNRTQIAYGYNKDAIHFRRYIGGEWKEWKEVAFKDYVDTFLPLSGGTIDGILNVNQSIDALFGMNSITRSLMRVYNEDNGTHYNVLKFHKPSLDVEIGDDLLDGNLVINSGYRGVVFKGNDGITLGSCRIWFDETNQCVRFSKGIASESFVSARGVDTSSDRTIQELQEKVAMLEAQLINLTNS